MRLTTIDVGGLKTKNNIFLAPLAGYTNAIFRKMCFDLGAGLTFTEMVSAKGLLYDSEKTRALLQLPPEYGGINACQLFGNEPETIRKAAESEDLAPYELIDINMGCPVPKIYKNGEGSALLNNIPLAEKIISECKKSGKRVSVKLRIGIDSSSICGVKFAKACENAGADMITVHGRTRDKMYAGEVNFGEIERIKNSVKIPVIANGGVFTATDAENLMNKTGADGVMIARGAMYNPFVFADICLNERVDKQKIVRWQLEKTFEYYGERFATVYMRKMIGFYLKGQKDTTALRVKLLNCNNKEEIENILNDIEF